jgi:hypothetical protein
LRSPRTNSVNTETLALLFCFVSPKIQEEKTKNKSTSKCPKVTGTTSHVAYYGRVLRVRVRSINSRHDNKLVLYCMTC